MSRPFLTLLAVSVPAFACGGSTGPSFSYVGEWVGQAQSVGSQYLHADLRIDSASATSVSGFMLLGADLSSMPTQCGAATQGGPFNQGQLYSDSLVFIVVGPPGTGQLRYRVKRVGDKLSLSGSTEILLSRC